MNDKRATLRERAQRFRRRMNGKDRAVSPVVATLILILIAVAAAAALYLWLVVWQGHITSGIGNVGAQPTLYIGGSTSVYPFDVLAVTQFEQNNSDVTINNEQGGSTAGMLGVCAGDVNIGAASFPVTPAVLVDTYGCSASVESTITVTTVAYDAVDVILPSANPHGLQSINFDTLALVYADASAAAGQTPGLVPLSIGGGSGTVAAPDGALISALKVTTPIPTPSTILAGTPSTYLQWDQIPATVNGADLTLTVDGTTGVSVTQAVNTATYSGTSTPVTCGPGTAPTSDICDNSLSGGTTGLGTPCGFLVCAGGSTEYPATDAISTVARSDASGTTQSFEARLLDAESSTTFATAAELQSPTQGFSGCGSNNLISDCKYAATKTGDGNPGVIAAVADDGDAIGYASDGLARAAGSGVTEAAFLGVGQALNAYASGNSFGNTVEASWAGAILPTTGASGTIALGIKASSPTAAASDYTTGYLGWRPFDLVTLATPAGVAAEFLNFVTNPGVNPNLATESQEVSIFSVGAV